MWSAILQKDKAIRQEEIDKHVFEEVLNLLKTPSLVQKELDRGAKETSKTDELEQREIILKKEFAKLSYERDRLLDAYQSGVIELKELKRRNQEIEMHRKNHEKDLKEFQALKLQAEEVIG